MTLLYLLAGGITLALLIYLVIALLNPCPAVAPSSKGFPAASVRTALAA